MSRLGAAPRAVERPSGGIKLMEIKRLLDALPPGQTGCLRAGRYRQYELRAHHGGTPDSRIVLASAPGERATIVVDTDVYLPAGITDVTVRDQGPGIPDYAEAKVFEKFVQIAAGAMHVSHTNLPRN